MTSFRDLGLPEALEKKLVAMNFKKPTPVQAKAIPLALKGKDLLVTAQTGTGKTAAFAIPLIARILNQPRSQQSLILVPTRELAEQIGSVLMTLSRGFKGVSVCVVIGGTSFPEQVKRLRSRPTFVIGTPGRLIDQIREKNLELENFGVLVIDEADRLLDMGFEAQMNEIVRALPKIRQTLLFSATLPPEIQGLAKRYSEHHERVAIGEVSRPVERIQQEVIRVKLADKPEALVEELKNAPGRALVFVSTKVRVEKVYYVLREAGQSVARIHGDRSQAQRSQAIEDFRDGRAQVLVATDVAARGLDIPRIEHVLNFDLPSAPEDYIHRIGRTGRAGRAGHSVAFVTPEDEFVWAKIHKLMYGRYPTEFRAPPKPAKDSGDGKKKSSLPFRRADESARQVPKTGGNRAERRAKAFAARTPGKKKPQR